LELNEDVDMEAIIRVDRVAALLEAWVGDAFPFNKIKIKILDRGQGDYLAVANVSIRNIATMEPEYIAGIGATLEEARDDLFLRFVALVRDNTPEIGLSEENFEWASVQDF
jgi:hypothetical protein